MSSTAKRLRKNIKALKFPVDMYNNTFGSYAICQYIINQCDNAGYVNKIWKGIRSGELTPPESLNDLCAMLDIPNTESDNIAYVQGKHNSLFLIIYNNELYPIREDGVMPTKTLGEAMFTNDVYYFNTMEKIWL